MPNPIESIGPKILVGPVVLPGTSSSAPVASYSNAPFHPVSVGMCTQDGRREAPSGKIVGILLQLPSYRRAPCHRIVLYILTLVHAYY
jgi:hypothetical protein